MLFHQQALYLFAMFFVFVVATTLAACLSGSQPRPEDKKEIFSRVAKVRKKNMQPKIWPESEQAAPCNLAKRASPLSASTQLKNVNLSVETHQFRSIDHLCKFAKQLISCVASAICAGSNRPLFKDEQHQNLKLPCQPMHRIDSISPPSSSVV